MRKLSLFVIMVIVVFLVFTVSCVSKEVPVAETYYETAYRTEYRTESYTEIGKERQAFLAPKRVWHHWMYFKELEWGKEVASSYYTGFEITIAGHSKSQIRLILTLEPVPWAIAVYDITGVGQIPSPSVRPEFAGETVLERGS